MDDLDPFAPKFTPTARRPLLGMTVLVVEDSRFASEALRLMCLRSGARIRRADCLRSARRHLQVYRPSIMVIDLGLPDGSGLELIEDLNQATPRVGAILAISGEDDARPRAMAAGADRFLAKPIKTLGAFQQAATTALPKDMQTNELSVVSDEVVDPDPLAFRDDMSHIASLLDAALPEQVLDYAAQFLKSVARTAEDDRLERAATEFTQTRTTGRTDAGSVARLAGVVHERLDERIAI